MEAEDVRAFDDWLDEPTADEARAAAAARQSLEGPVVATEDELTEHELRWLAEMERVGRIQTEEVLVDADQVQPS